VNDLATQITSNTEVFLFYAAAFVMLPLAFGVLIDRNIIRAGFLLIGVFGGVSLLFLLLQAQFLAMAQIMIYAVGITLVVVIALMLTNPRLESDKSIDLPKQRIPAFLTSMLVFMVLYMAILSEAWPKMNEFPNNADNIKILGTSLLTHYALPFEFSSVLLLVALIGAVMLARADRVQPQEELQGDETSVVESEGNEHVVVK
jgi:NADH:ubiquinone oxidoreductase subunit 6 (subunit J)